MMSGYPPTPEVLGFYAALRVDVPDRPGNASPAASCPTTTTDARQRRSRRTAASGTATRAARAAVHTRLRWRVAGTAATPRSCASTTGSGATATSPTEHRATEAGSRPGRAPIGLP